MIKFRTLVYRGPKKYTNPNFFIAFGIFDISYLHPCLLLTNFLKVNNLCLILFESFSVILLINSKAICLKFD